jgi:lipoprotein-anchoring transpeptidase ErfK/SrfK
MRNIFRLGIAFLFWVGLHSAASAVVRIDVDLSTQTMHVAAGDGEQFEWPISSGRPGHATPRGNFRPHAMYAMAHSAKYGNAPMPHSIFFYGQYAIHGTTAVGNLGHVASHGCIRIAPENAATLFALVSREGARITVEGSPPGDFQVASAHHFRHSGRMFASAQHRRYGQTALAYAPRHSSRTLKQWAADPLGR